MIHSKLTQLLAAFALALVAGGCAMEAAPEDPSTAADDSAELREQPGASTPATAVVAGGGAQAPIESLIRQPVVLDLRTLGESVDVDGDGPRPHPWTPAPESNGGSGSTNAGNTGAAPSSPSK